MLNDAAVSQFKKVYLRLLQKLFSFTVNYPNTQGVFYFTE